MNLTSIGPDPETFVELRKNAIANRIMDLATYHGVMVGSLVGHARLRSQVSGSALARLSLRGDSRCCGKKGRVPVATLDRLTPSVDQIDLMMIDVREHKLSLPASAPWPLSRGCRLALEVLYGSRKEGINDPLQNSEVHLMEMRYKIP